MKHPRNAPKSTYHARHRKQRIQRRKARRYATASGAAPHSNKDRNQFAQGARIGRKYGFGDGIKNRLFRNMSSKRTDSFAKGFRTAYSQSFRAGNAQRHAATGIRRLFDQ